MMGTGQTHPAETEESQFRFRTKSARQRGAPRPTVRTRTTGDVHSCSMTPTPLGVVGDSGRPELLDLMVLDDACDEAMDMEPRLLRAESCWYVTMRRKIDSAMPAFSSCSREQRRRTK